MPPVSLKRVAAPVGEWNQCPAELTAGCHPPASLDESTDIKEAQFQPNGEEQMPRMSAAAPPEEIGATTGPPAAYLSLDSLRKILTTPREQPCPTQPTNSSVWPQPDEKKEALAKAAAPSRELDQRCRKMIVHHPPRGLEAPVRLSATCLCKDPVATNLPVPGEDPPPLPPTDN